ncbi:helix-turn-helix domain-containing protein [Nocardia vinacea]|uniref:Helix-turn-helix domain-containing protein n=1 Tax=Nocardia vinacea TaxID=96468 RepID=A0ABZ1YSQ0_9NOCA|nr:helix-turn-helix domain-containing protein [Nocardia vinacea]
MVAFPPTLAVGPLTNLDAWREVVAETFVPHDVTAVGPGADFHGSLHSRAVADVQLSVITGSGQLGRRTSALIRRRPSDVYNVGLPLRGRGLFEQSGRTAEVAAGDLVMCDTARPCTLHFERDFELLVLVVPRRRLAMRVPGLEDLTGVRIPGSSGNGALAASLLRGLDPRTVQPGPEATHLSDAAIDLLAACLVGCEGGCPDSSGDTVVAIAHRYIDDHLRYPSLTPAEIASAAHVSLRQLQKLFAQRGSTISGWIRDRRLERCWHDLANPRLASRPVAVVAASWGLVDAPQFSRAFRARYGIAPREHRACLLEV